MPLNCVNVFWQLPFYLQKCARRIYSLFTKQQFMDIYSIEQIQAITFNFSASTANKSCLFSISTDSI